MLVLSFITAAAIAAQGECQQVNWDDEVSRNASIAGITALLGPSPQTIRDAVAKHQTESLIDLNPELFIALVRHDSDEWRSDAVDYYDWAIERMRVRVGHPDGPEFDVSPPRAMLDFGNFADYSTGAYDPCFMPHYRDPYDDSIRGGISMRMAALAAELGMTEDIETWRTHAAKIAMDGSIGYCEGCGYRIEDDLHLTGYTELMELGQVEMAQRGAAKVAERYVQQYPNSQGCMSDRYWDNMTEQEVILPWDHFLCQESYLEGATDWWQRAGISAGAIALKTGILRTSCDGPSAIR